MQLNSFISRLFSLSLFALPVLAVIQDEAYELDWHIPVVGNSIRSSTFFHRPQPESKASLIYTVTDRKVVAAIHPRDGSIVWRQSLAPDLDTSTTEPPVALPADGKVITAAGRVIRAWDAADGRLHWSIELNVEINDAKLSKEQDVVVLGTDGSVRKIDGQVGSVIEDYYNFLPQGHIPYKIHLSSDAIIVTSLIPKGDTHVIHTTNIYNREKINSVTLPESNILVPGFILFVGGPGIAAWIEDQGKVLMLLSLGTESMNLVPVPEGVIRIELHTVPDHNTLLISFDSLTASWAEVWKLEGEYGILTKVYSIPEKPYSPTSWSANIASNGEIYFTWSLPEGASEIYGGTSAEPLYSVTGNATNIAFAYLSVSEVIPRIDGTFALRTFLTSYPDGDTHLTLNGGVSWTRPESLAGLKATCWVELLDSATEEVEENLHVEESQNVLAAYIHRVKRHVYELMTYGPSWARNLPNRIISEFTGGKAETVAEGKFRDGFGFRKLLVGVTTNGGMVGIDFGQKGKILWRVNHIMPRRAGEVKGLYEVGKGVVGMVSDAGRYVEIDVFEGKVLKKQGAGDVRKVESTSLVSGVGDRKVILAIVKTKAGYQVKNYGGDEPAAITKDVYLTMQDDYGNLQGYRVSPKSLTPEKTFSFSPPEMELVSSITYPIRSTPPTSIGKVMGDRSVMYKYLNPNVVFLTTTRLDGSNTASVYLLDSVSGVILYTAQHTSIDMSSPFVSVLCENWFVYTFYADVGSTDDAASSGKTKGYQIVVTELYESPIRNDRGPLRAEANFSAFDPEVIKNKPFAITQNYISPVPIITLSTTSTKQSITTIDILAVLSHPAALLSIPKRLLDPRRPVDREPDNAEREEGLFKYDPVLPVDHRSILSHKRELLWTGGDIKVTSSPTLMESTGLVFLWSDTDLFGTRVQPSAGFDMLGRGFGRVQLVGTVVGLAVGVAVVAPIVRRRQINLRWGQSG